MEKKEKKADLEQLLNSLIEKGFRPFGKKAERCLGIRYNNDWSEMYRYVGFWGGDEVVADWKVPLRSLVSVDSGLWQFVCENGMVKKEGGYRAKRRHLHGWEHDEDVYHDISHTKNDYEYYLIESSLKDESELEDFLLQNIVIKDE